MLIPRVRTFLFEPFQHVAHRRKVFQLFAATVAKENNDGHAPETLSRYAPIRSLLNHFSDSFFTPAWKPFDRVRLRQRFFAQRFRTSARDLIHFDKPLLCRSKNHRIVASPTMWIAMFVRMMSEKRPAIT